MHSHRELITPAALGQLCELRDAAVGSLIALGAQDCEECGGIIGATAAESDHAPDCTWYTPGTGS